MGVGAVDDDAEGSSRRGAAGEEEVDSPEEEEDDDTFDDEEVRDAVPRVESASRRFEHTIRLEILTRRPRLAVVELTGSCDRCSHNSADLAQQLLRLGSILVVLQHLIEDSCFVS